ncbi:MAG: hypothetical protein JNJ94_02755 [Chlorobi bacterium]|nr:hypothetical protein [Chlorobiota bacterium]
MKQITTLAAMAIFLSTSLLAQPDFKGLRLGMTIQEVNALITTTRWGWKSRDQKIQNAPEKDDSIFYREGYGYPLIADGSFDNLDRVSDKDTFMVIGCENVRGSYTCYSFQEAMIEPYEGKAMRLTVTGTDYKYSYASLVLGWCEVAQHGLTEKYGKPTKVNYKIEGKSLIDMEPSHIYTMVEWIEYKDAKRKKNPLWSIAIKLHLSSKKVWTPEIAYTDLVALKASAEKEKKLPKYKSGF